MNCILLIVKIIMSCIAITYGWTATEQTDNSQSHPGYCYSNIKDVGAMKKGEVKMKTGECVKIECKEGGLMIHTGCVQVDLKKFYPHCCAETKQ